MRSSNFELLRVVAMLMIIAYHIVCHCVNYQITDPKSIALMENGYFSSPVVFRRFLLIDAAMPLGPAANVIFILISGYFICPKEDKPDIGSVSKKLLLYQGFAAILLILGSAVAPLVAGFAHVSYVGFQPISLFNTMSWFVGYYFLVMLIARLFLNRFLAGLSRTQYSTFLLAFLALTQFGWVVSLTNGLTSGLNTLLVGVFLYALGGYIRLYRPFEKVRSVTFVAIILATFALTFLADNNMRVRAVQDYLLGGSQGAYVQPIVTYSTWNAVPVILGFCTFMLFSRVRMPQSRVVNFLGAATFMVYLIHDNDFFYWIWRSKDWARLLFYSQTGFVAALAVWTLATFAVGVGAYVLFLLASRLLKAMRGLFLKD